MLAEMERSKTQLKMDNLPAPYYVEYHVSDVDEFDAEAAFGALRLNQRTHGRSLRVVVRVGDYKQDSFGPGAGQGVADRAPLDNDPVALRRALWLATDRAYKAATQALASKKAAQSQFSGDQGFDDFAHAQPLQSVGPLAKLDVDSKPWTDALVKSSALFRTDPQDRNAYGAGPLPSGERVFREQRRDRHAARLGGGFPGADRFDASGGRNAAGSLACFCRSQDIRPAHTGAVPGQDERDDCHV